MWKWPWRRSAAHTPPQSGSSKRSLRWKTYSSETGYVYQYVLRGRRPWQQAPGDGVEYLFHATRNREEVFAISVVLTNATIALWSRHHRRDLRDAEQYAVAKLSLLAAFDSYETQDLFQFPIFPDIEMFEQTMSRLDL